MYMLIVPYIKFKKEPLILGVLQSRPVYTLIYLFIS